MKNIYLITFLILISCEATTKILPDQIEVSAIYPQRIVPLSDGNSWTYEVEGTDSIIVRQLISGGTKKWVEILDSANVDSDIQLGSFESFEILINSVNSKLAYCYKGNDIYLGSWDTTRQSYNIIFIIEDFPAIGRYSYNHRMIDIITLDLVAGRAYDCYIWENELTKDRCYFYRGLGLVRVEFINDKQEIIFAMQLTDYSIK